MRMHNFFVAMPPAPVFNPNPGRERAPVRIIFMTNCWLRARTGSREYIGHKVQSVSGNPLV